MFPKTHAVWFLRQFAFDLTHIVYLEKKGGIHFLKSHLSSWNHYEIVMERFNDLPTMK